MKKSIVIIIAGILIDQFLKIYVKTHFFLGEEFFVFSFFRIVFIENPGMAYGISIYPGYIGKIILGFLRLFFIIFIFFFHIKNIVKRYKSLIIPISLILSGSIGNFLDCALYGILFDSGTIYSSIKNKWIPYFGISKINNIFFGEKYKGYASFMEGCVVDMFYCPIINFSLSEKIPFIGNNSFNIFKPIFNLSDVFILIGIIFVFFYSNSNKTKNKFFF